VIWDPRGVLDSPSVPSGIFPNGFVVVYHATTPGDKDRTAVPTAYDKIELCEALKKQAAWDRNVRQYLDNFGAVLERHAERQESVSYLKHNIIKKELRK